jgi:hypothetical protein
VGDERSIERASVQLAPKTNVHLAQPDPEFDGMLLRFVRHITIYKAIKDAGLMYDPIAVGEPRPGEFFPASRDGFGLCNKNLIVSSVRRSLTSCAQRQFPSRAEHANWGGVDSLPSKPVQLRRGISPTLLSEFQIDGVPERFLNGVLGCWSNAEVLINELAGQSGNASDDPPVFGWWAFDPRPLREIQGHIHCFECKQLQD